MYDTNCANAKLASERYSRRNRCVRFIQTRRTATAQPPSSAAVSQWAASQSIQAFMRASLSLFGRPLLGRLEGRRHMAQMLMKRLDKLLLRRAVAILPDQFEQDA